MVTEEILSPTAFAKQWTSTDYCKTHDFFFCSPPSLTTMRFSHSPSMDTSLGESSKFQMSST